MFESCQNSKTNGDDQGPDLFPQPKTFPVNTEGGYVTNVITGDTIQPIINSNGDTVITGKLIPAIGKVIHPDSVLKPKSIPAGQGKVVPAHPNVHLIPDNLTTIPVDESKLKKIVVKEGENHFILNSIGDTVKTGVPISANGRVVPCLFPKLIPVMPMQMKNNVIGDIRYLDMDQGLPSSFVTCVLEDHHGYLWFGTDGSGVCKYDGKSILHYTTKEGLLSNVVHSIIEDKSGNIWIGTFDAITKYDGTAFTNYFIGKSIRSICEDHFGNIWFGTDGNGVIKFNGSSFLYLTISEGLPDNTVRSIMEDHMGNLWFGTDKGLAKFNGEYFLNFGEEEGLPNRTVLSLLEDNNSTIWIGTYGGGVANYNGKIFTHYGEKDGLSNNRVYSILEDQKGNLWFGTNGGGISKYNGLTFTYYTENNGLPHNSVFSILEDRNQNLWICTIGGGIAKLSVNSFTHFNENDLLANHPVINVFEDSKGTLWFGTWDAGLLKYDGSTFTKYVFNDGLPNDVVMSIYEDFNGNLWVGTRGGAAIFNGKEFVTYTVDQGLTNDKIRHITGDIYGNIWFGTYGGGVSKFDGTTFTNYTINEGLSNNNIMHIYGDRSGLVWFASYGGGVTKYDGEFFTHYTTREGLSHDIVMTIAEDEIGNKWFGTDGGGLCQFDGQKFKYFTTAEGLVSNNIYSVFTKRYETLDSGIWVSTDQGLSFLNPVTGKLINYQKEDGLKGEYFFLNSSYLDSRGGIWFANNKALEMIDLQKFKFPASIPQSKLRYIEINEQFFDFRHMGDSLKTKTKIEFKEVERFENYPTDLILPFEENHLIFHYSAIEMAAPHKLKYQYKLDGLDETWSAVSDKTFADYRNIPYGTFTFKVRAIGESQVWGEPFEYTFTILPPWWHTWWARTLYALLALTLILILMRWRTAKLKARQKQLERDIERATAEIVQQKNEVEKQKEQVEDAHKEITDSIHYAERLQRSLMSCKKLLDENLGNYFVYFNPKEAVSGDFYWSSHLQNGKFVLVCADSTGHGVPGSIMSMMNMNSLKEAVKEGKNSSDEILNHTRSTIIQTLANDGSAEGGKDGMDAVLLIFNNNKTELEFSMANNPLWIIRPSTGSGLGFELLEFKPDKMPVGKHDKQDQPFTRHSEKLQKGDLIYIFTDGYADQFGGEKGKKFKYSSLKELFLSIADKSMEEQKLILSKTFDNWKGSLEQVDDVCVIGVRV